MGAGCFCQSFFNDGAVPGFGSKVRTRNAKLGAKAPTMRPVVVSHRHGAAWLTASVEGGVTRLTRVAHRAPMRLLPMQPPSVAAAGAAACALGSYGGGLLGGDVVDLHVRAERGAVLALTTQASTKIYKAKADGAPTQQRLTAEVAAGALLVVAPDPLVPFGQSAYAGLQRYALEPGASLVAVDWVGSGRVSSGERWAHGSFSTRTELSWAAAGGGDAASPGCCGPATGGGAAAVGGGGGVAAGSGAAAGGGAAEASRPWLVEAVQLVGGPGSELAFDLGETRRDAYATVVLVGSQAAPVVSRFYSAAAALALRRMRSAGGMRGAAAAPQPDATGCSL